MTEHVLINIGAVVYVVDTLLWKSKDGWLSLIQIKPKHSL